MYDIFQTRKSDCKLRSQTDFASNCVNTNKLRLNSPRYFASKVWNYRNIKSKNSKLET